MSLIHSQARVDCPWLIDRFFFVFFDFLTRVLAQFLEDEIALFLHFLDVFFEKILVFLVLIEKTHCGLKIFSLLLISMHDYIIEKFFLLF